MRIDITRKLIESAVTKAIHDIERDPDRSTRNMVDLAMTFSRGRFQRHFMETIQTMLARQDSPYYLVAKRAAANVNHETLKTFGINIGYNSFTRGAKTIRGLEASRGINIPWIITLEYDGVTGHTTVADIDDTIRAGKAMGIFSYAVFCKWEDTEKIEALLRQHDDCAFIVYLIDGDGDEQKAIDRLSLRPNTMVAVSTEDRQYASLMKRMKEERMLCCAYKVYRDADVEAILSGAWVEGVLSTECLFAMLIADEGCSTETKKRVAQYVRDVRVEQRYPVLLLELYTDIIAIDSVVSDQGVCMAVRADGSVYANNPDAPTAENITRDTLAAIMERVMPAHGQDCPDPSA